MPKLLKMRWAQLFGLLVAGIQALWGQPLSFRQFSVAQGLPGYSVISITQDKKGFMWLGTTDGLCRFDGTRFKVYRRTAAPFPISNNNIISLFTDSKGNMWAGTSGGLNRYNEQKDIFENIPLNGKKDGHIFSICGDAKGALWVGGSNGLVRVSNNQTTALSYFSGQTVKAVFEDRGGKIWVGSERGISVIQDKNGKTTITTLNALAPDAPDPAPRNITTIAEDANGSIWIGTQSNGAYRFTPATGRLTRYQSSNTSLSGLINNNIRCIFLDKNNRLWIGTQEGISISSPPYTSFLNIEHVATDKTSLSQNSVYSIFQDSNGSVWVGTYFGGVNLCYAYTTRFFTIQNNGNANSISNNVISSIVEDRYHNLWIGTEGGGLNNLNTNNGIFTTYKHSPNIPTSLGSNLIKVVFLDKDGNTWVGTHGGGLNVLPAGMTAFRKYLIDTTNISGNEITSISEDLQNNLWIASNSGVYVFKRSGTALTLLSKNFSIRGIPKYLFRDRRNNLWIASSSGVYLLNGTALKDINPTYSVNCFAEDPSGDIWMGTSNSGLLKFNKNNGQIIPDKNALLKSSNIFGLLTHPDGSLWISTNKGLVHYHPKTNHYQVYTQNDGIAGNEFNYNSFLKSSDGQFYFGGFNGITHFSPDDIKINPFAASLVFTGLKLHNKEVTVNDVQKILKENITSARTLTFAYDQDLFTVEFALLNYIKGEKNTFLYQLEGFDKTWNQSTVPSATYTNLPSGTYRFIVKGSNNDGVWSPAAAITIVVKPPFWLTWWAYCIYIILCGVIIFFIVRFFFLRALIKKEDELHQAKLNFFTNASHEIRTHLTLIMAPVERLLSEDKKEGFIQQQLTQVKANTNRLLSLVSELMDFRKAETNHLQLSPRQQDLIAFLQDIYESFREMSLSKNISMSFVHDEDTVTANFDEQQLEKVFFNLLANAFKFTPEGGTISLQVLSQGPQVTITVTDNGRGIAPQYLEKLFTNFFQVADHGLQNTGYGIGLALSKNIIELHKGSISVESTPAQKEQAGKTVFTVVLPKNALLPHFQQEIMKQPGLPLNPEAIESADVEKQHLTLPEGFKNTVLVVEDNAALRQLIKETLSPAYNIITAATGLLGWEAAISEIPDLIVSDVMMPEMDGYALCEKIKQDERTCHIPVILLTAKSSQSEQVTGLQQGADLYLTKPFSTKVLTLSVQNLLMARERIKQKLTRELVSLPVFLSEKKQEEAPVFSNSLDRAFLDKVVLLINEHIDNPDFGVDMLSRKVAMSAPVLYKKLRALTNMSVNEFIKLQRFKKAAELLAQKTLTVNEVSFAVGYDDRKYFSREFKKYFGVLPSEFPSQYSG